MQKLSWKSIQEQFPKYAAQYANEFKNLFNKSGKTELSIEDIDNYLKTAESGLDKQKEKIREELKLSPDKKQESYKRNYEPCAVYESCQTPEEKGSVCLNCGWERKFHIDEKETSLIAYKIGGYTRYFNDNTGRVLGRVEVADNGDSQCYDTGGSLLGRVIGGQTFASNGVLLSPQDILSSLLVNENRVQANKKASQECVGCGRYFNTKLVNNYGKAIYLCPNCVDKEKEIVEKLLSFVEKNSFKNLVNWFKSASYESETFKSKTIGEFEVQLNEVYFEEDNKRSYDFSELSLYPIKYTEGKPGKLPSRQPIKVKKFYDTVEAEEMYNKINNEVDFNLLGGRQGATEQILYIDYANGKFESWFYSEGDRYRFMESYDIDEIMRKAKRQEFNKFVLTEEAKMFRRGNKKANIYPTQMEEALGLQPGELYGEDEVYEEPEGAVEYKGYTIELSFEQSGSVYPFKAFAMGIGTTRGKDEIEAINWMKKKIDSKVGSKKADVPTQSTLFDINTADEVINRLNTELEAPYKSIQKSTLGGAENVSIIATISLDSKETWSNGILQNSRYMMFYIYRDGTIEQFSKNYTIEPKFRKTKAKNVDELLYKLNSYFGTAQGFERNPNLKKANKLVKDIPEEFTFTNNDIEVRNLNQEFSTDYDSFFIKVSEGEYETIYGMYGIVPFKTVSVYEVYQNKTANKQANDAKHGDISSQKFFEELFDTSWKWISKDTFLQATKWQEGITLLKEMRNEPVEKKADERLIDPRMTIPESYSPLHEERSPNPEEWTSYSMEDIYEEEEEQPSKYIPKKKQRGKYNLHEIVMTPEGRGRIVMKQVDYEPYSYTVALTGKDEITIVEEPQIQRLASIGKQAMKYKHYLVLKPIILESMYGSIALKNDDWFEIFEDGQLSTSTGKTIESSDTDFINIDALRKNNKILLMKESEEGAEESIEASIGKKAKRNDARYWAVGNLELWVDGDQLEYDDEIEKIKNSSISVEEKIIKAKDRVEALVLEAIDSLKVSSDYSDIVHLNSFRRTEVLDIDEQHSNINYFDLVNPEIDDEDIDWESLKESSKKKESLPGEVPIEEQLQILEKLRLDIDKAFTPSKYVKYYQESIDHHNDMLAIIDAEINNVEQEIISKSPTKQAKSVGWLRDKFLNKIDKIADVAAEVNDEFKKEREDGEGKGISLMEYYTTGRYHAIEKPLSADNISKSQAEKLMEDLVYQFKTELFAIYNISSGAADEIVEKPKGVSMKDIEELEEGTDKESAIEKEITYYPMDSISTGYPSTQYLKDIVEPVKQPEGKYLSY